ncbi:hypothetical protein ZOSMA_6G00470 [Zostera marina]|uniref:Uncharacterized protein n=1 Tax=Zostera marina TaxID=29655 RepID=A0A0K9NRA8_ZOSMR|nr:hypothetical protein ZOSMA_6G00470 [Zostera marina]
MDNNCSSYGTSWADQWDSGSDSGRTAPTSKQGSNSNMKNMMNKEKINAGLVKTKEVAATGFNKVKKGTNSSVNWMKEKYRNMNNKR